MYPSKRNSNLVLIMNKVEVAGDFNPIITWEEFSRAWVSIDPVRGRETYMGDEKESVVTHKIRGDFLSMSGITAEMMIVYNDTHEYDTNSIREDSLVFDILAVMPNYDMRDDVMINATLEPLNLGEIGMILTHDGVLDYSDVAQSGNLLLLVI